MSNRVYTLDSIRGICALGVALHHFKGNGQIVQLPIVQNAFLFVDLFFVLSGFVIAMVYFAELGSRDGMRDFVVKRFARLYPLHLFVLAVFFLMELLIAPVFSQRAPFTGPMSLESLLLNVSLLNSINLTDGLTWNYPSWSIGAEFMAYVVFAGAVWVLGRRSIIVFALLVPTCLAVLAFMSPDYIDATHDFGFVRCMAGFSIGVLVWRMASSELVRRIALSLPRTIFTVAEVSLCTIVILFVWFAGHTEANLFSPLLFAALVGCFFYQRGVVSDLLATRALVWLGTLSYSIYMVHAFIASRFFSSGLELIERVTPFNVLSEDGLFGATPMAGNVMVAFYMLLVIITAAATHRYVEMQGQKWVRRLFGVNALRSKPSQSVR